MTRRPEEILDDPVVVPLNWDIVEALRRAQEIAGEDRVNVGPVVQHGDGA